ncbi:MAG: V-type ATPase subunit, partial [Synergistaceae bacterium]|nr:V-type ATPase subunit [Synergistaceae bacterium]
MYALSRLRAMENRFLDAPFFSRLMESATIDDAVKSLSDTVYGRWLSAGGKGHGKGSGHGHENF